jgi:hypothetical protein
MRLVMSRARFRFPSVAARVVGGLTKDWCLTQNCRLAGSLPDEREVRPTRFPEDDLMRDLARRGADFP